MSRIALLTTEPLPLPGWPTTGAGLRAWGLAQGLRAKGHEVRLFFPEKSAQGFSPVEGDAPPTHDFPDWIIPIRRNELKNDPRLQDADVLILQHWGIARDLGEIRIPLAIDLAGPHLLERKLWGSESPEGDLIEKLDALRKADFVTASGEWQRFYFLPYLALAGWNIASAANSLPTIPYSLKASESNPSARSDRFIYGGFFLPWQNPTRAIETLLQEMDSAGRGELIFIGGAHPTCDVSRGTFDALIEKLREHPRVKFYPPMSYDRFIAFLGEGGIALDLMERNAERELAFTSRTVQCMASGLPVIYNNYSELSGIIERAGAGWTFDPADMDGLRKLLRGLLKGEIEPTAQSEAARKCVQEQLDWEKTISPLDQFCREPKYRDGKIAAQLDFETRDLLLARTKAELSRTQAELNAIRGKRWVRWGMDLLSLRAPARYIAGLFSILLALALIPIFAISDRWTRPS